MRESRTKEQPIGREREVSEGRQEKGDPSKGDAHDR